MSLLQAITDKPWLENTNTVQASNLSYEKVRRAGLRLLLAVIAMLFFLFLVAFLMRSQYPDWQPLAEEPLHPLYEQSTLWLNTIFLILGSVAIQSARFLSKRSQKRSALTGLLLAGMFSMAFVTGQLMLWQQLVDEGFVVNSNPAISFFYLFTGLHAAHVGIGLLAWLVAVVASFRHTKRCAEVINLCAIYWHFLLGLWGMLFALLVSKPETYDAIAAFCGLR